MGIDVRIVGLGCVSLIISALMIYSIMGEKVGDPIRVLSNQHPLNYRVGEEEVYSLALLTRNRHDDVRVEFSMLMLKRLDFLEMVDAGLAFNGSSEPEDVLRNSKKLAWFSNQTRSLGVEPEIYEKSLEIQGNQFRVLIQDYGVLQQLLGEESVSDQPLIYGAAIDETGEAFYLEGFRDFFYQPGANIRSVSIIHGDEETVYVPDGQVLEGSGRFPLSQAPRGSVVFESRRRDDTVKVMFTVKVFSLPQGFYSKELAFMQIIRIYLNGELYVEPIINVVGSV